MNYLEPHFGEVFFGFVASAKFLSAPPLGQFRTGVNSVVLENVLCDRAKVALVITVLA